MRGTIKTGREGFSSGGEDDGTDIGIRGCLFEDAGGLAELSVVSEDGKGSTRG